MFKNDNETFGEYEVQANKKKLLKWIYGNLKVLYGRNMYASAKSQ